MTDGQLLLYICIVNYVSIAIMLMQPFHLLKLRYTAKTRIYWITTVVLFVYALLPRLLMPENVALRAVLGFGGLLLAVLFLFEDSTRRKLAVYAAVVFLTLLSEGLTYLILSGGETLDYAGMLRYNDAALKGMIIVNMIAFILNIYAVFFWRWFVDKLRLKGMLLYLSVPLYQLVLLLLYVNAVNEFNSRTAALGVSLLILGISINLVIMFLLQNLERKLEVEEKLSYLYRQRQRELDYYRMSQRYLDQMREIRHEFINQIQTAYLLIQKGDSLDRAQKLLEESYQKLQDTKLVRYSENPVINALISVKAEKCDQKSIEFLAACQLGDVGGMEEIDLCSLFGNMLDNAIEACCRMPQGEHRKLALKSKVRGGYQIVRTENTYSPKENAGNFFRTTKEDRLNHGYGMKLIERICHKYGGELKTQVTEDQVFVTAYLDLEKTAAQNTARMDER